MPVPLVRVGVKDEFSQSAKLTKESDELISHFGFRAVDLAQSVKDCIAKKQKLAQKTRKRVTA
jgi:transketolase C-terminal domain/subunit